VANEAHPDWGRKELKKRKAAEKKYIYQKKQTTELAGADGHITRLARDNSMVPDGDEHPAEVRDL
jgi:hypothetical protein